MAGNVVIWAQDEHLQYLIKCHFSLIILELIRKAFLQLNQRYLERSHLHNFKSHYVIRTAELMQTGIYCKIKIYCIQKRKQRGSGNLQIRN